MPELFWNTTTDNMRLVLSGFMKSGAGSYFYLAGGTALSLQLGHRLSVDLDFFSPTEDIPSIRLKLEEALQPYRAILADSAWGNLVYLTNEVRVGFYGYGFPLIAPIVETEGIRLASVEDIALMKLDAMLSRAARKDFYDLYFICQNLLLSKIFQKAPQKYPSVRDFEVQATKRLTFFENAEKETDPILLKDVKWDSVKDFFIQQAREIELSWLK
jgi:predicted nucleotidyltransferase component of viral defense system